MYPIYPSLKGGGVLSLEHIKVDGLKLFSAISKTSGKDSVNNPNLKKVNIIAIIANNIRTLYLTQSESVDIFLPQRTTEGLRATEKYNKVSVVLLFLCGSLWSVFFGLAHPV
ncbi:hypothetical protein BH10BAC3_BH10BAC3_12540 [soil metagenome]